LPETHGSGAARRARPRPQAARHGRRRRRGERLRRHARRGAAEHDSRRARRRARRPRPDLRTRAPDEPARDGGTDRLSYRRADPRRRVARESLAPMNVGVVGNPSYGDLQGFLGRLTAAAPRYDFTLFTEERLAAIWPGQPPAVWGPGVQLDCLLTVGGDGTLLRGARLLNRAGTPIL